MAEEENKIKLIVKPNDEKHLPKKIIKNINNLYQKSNKEYECVDEIVNSGQKCTNLNYLNLLTKSDTKLQIEMIELYLHQTPTLIVEMKKSFIHHDWIMLNASMHKLIPSFFIVGIHSDFEKMAKKIQDYTNIQVKTGDITKLIFDIETACIHACKELEKEIEILKLKLL